MTGSRPLLLLSDLHLPASPSPLRDGFLRFLAGPARAADAVYLLGDIFEYWIGDDVGLDVYAPEVTALRALTDSGVAVHFMHGNRDFLVGRRFAQATGARLLEDPFVLSWRGQRVLLSHGDRWCTDDHAYQRWRRFSRNRLAQRIFTALPRRWREAVAGSVRASSRQHQRMSAEDITDVHPDAIHAAFLANHAELLIHGHTHRPATHQHAVDDRVCTRVVLPDWRIDSLRYLRLDSLPLSAGNHEFMCLT